LPISKISRLISEILWSLKWHAAILDRIFDVVLASLPKYVARKRYFFDGEIEACILLDGRDGRLYASALSNSSNDFSVELTLSSHPLSCRRSSASCSFFSHLRPVHNWFSSSACRFFDEFFKMQRCRSDEKSTDAISVSSTLCTLPSSRPILSHFIPSLFVILFFLSLLPGKSFLRATFANNER